MVFPLGHVHINTRSRLDTDVRVSTGITVQVLFLRFTTTKTRKVM